MIPSRSRTKIAAFSLPGAFIQRPAFNELTAHYVQSIFDQVGYRFDLRLCLKNLQPAHVVSTVDIFEDLDFQNPVPLETPTKLNLRITRDCQIQGFVVWLTLETFPGEQIDILANEHCWLPVFLPVFDPPAAVRPRRHPPSPSVANPFRQRAQSGLPARGRYRTRRASRFATFSWHSFHNRTVFQATPFYQRLFAQGRSPSPSSSRKPS